MVMPTKARPEMVQTVFHEVDRCFKEFEHEVKHAKSLMDKRDKQPTAKDRTSACWRKRAA